MVFRLIKLTTMPIFTPKLSVAINASAHKAASVRETAHRDFGLAGSSVYIYTSLLILIQFTIIPIWTPRQRRNKG